MAFNQSNYQAVYTSDGTLSYVVDLAAGTNITPAQYYNLAEQASGVIIESVKDSIVTEIKSLPSAADAPVQAVKWVDGPIPGVRIATIQSDGLFKSEPTGVATLPAAPVALANAIPSATLISQELSSALSSASKSVKSSGNIKITKPSKSTADFKMTLKSKVNSTDIVIFNVSPSIDESRNANYEKMTPTHHPGTMQIYKSTEARSFNISAKFISRTSEEATKNINFINLIRSWVMPYYGQGTALSMPDKLGAPPDILIFNAYGEKNINSLPVVLTSYHWVYPDTVDYIPTIEGIPFPTIIEVTLSLVEAYSPEEFTGFDIIQYKYGNMVGAYTFSSNPTGTADTPYHERHDAFSPIPPVSDGPYHERHDTGIPPISDTPYHERFS